MWNTQSSRIFTDSEKKTMELEEFTYPGSSLGQVRLPVICSSMHVLAGLLDEASELRRSLVERYTQLAAPLKLLALQQMMCYWSRRPASSSGILSTAAECLQVRQKQSDEEEELPDSAELTMEEEFKEKSLLEDKGKAS